MGAGFGPLWTALINSNGYTVLSSPLDGSLFARYKAALNSAIGNEIVIDPVALLTCDLLNLWEFLPRFFSKIYIADGTAELMYGELNMARLAQTWAFQNGKVVSIPGENAPNDIDQQGLVDRLGRINEHINQAPFVRVYVRPESFEFKKKYEKSGPISLPLVEASALAQQLKKPLWSDDFATSRLGWALFGIGFTPTFAVLQSALEKGMITETQMMERSIALAKSNYTFTPVHFRGVISDYGAVTGGPNEPLRKLMASMTNTSFGSTPASCLVGHMVGSKILSDFGFGDEWRTFGGELMALWAPEFRSYTYFCIGVAAALKDEPHLYFGVLREAARNLPTSLAGELQIAGVEVALTHAANSPGELNRKHWENAISTYQATMVASRRRRNSI